MPIAPNGPAPYPPAGKVIDVLERHRQVGLPTPVTTEVIERVTGTPGLAPRIVRALRLYDLIDKEGNPTAQFDELAKAPSEADFKERLAAVLRSAYADVFQYIDPATVTAEQLEGQFRSYTPRGQLDRMVAVFRGLSEYAGILEEGEAAKEAKSRAPRKASRPKATNGKPKRKPGETGLPRSPVPEDFQTSPPPASGQHPLIQGLLMALPPAGQAWPIRARENWTKAALANFELLYELGPDDERAGE